MEMTKRIELEKSGRQPGEIRELNLDNCKAKTLEGLTNEFCNLETLSMINVGLITLEGMPALPKLKKLELSANRISGSLKHLKACSNLTHLSLSGNKIKDIEALESLKDFPSLRSLDLYNCDVMDVDGYRVKVFELLTNLEVLDGCDERNHRVSTVKKKVVAAAVAVGAVGVGVAAVAAAPVVLGAAGFTSAGIAAGSIGANMMSVAATSGVGMGVVSTLQSAGAAGIGLAANTVIGTSAAATFATIANMFKTRTTKETDNSAEIVDSEEQIAKPVEDVGEADDFEDQIASDDLDVKLQVPKTNL